MLSTSYFTQNSLLHLIGERIGLKTFMKKINFISQHDSYVNVLENPRIWLNEMYALQFDYHFCCLYQGLILWSYSFSSDILFNLCVPKNYKVLLRRLRCPLFRRNHHLCLMLDNAWKLFSPLRSFPVSPLPERTRPDSTSIAKVLL